jgi:predicted metal-binding protein
VKEGDNRKKVLSLHAPAAREKPTFRSGRGISKKLIRQLLAKGKEYGLHEIASFGVDRIVLAEWVSLKCQYGCPQYNTNWCCPPASPDLKKVRAILGEYSLALLLVGTRRCPDFYSHSAKTRAYQVRYWKGTMSIERRLFLEGYDKAFSLVSGTCALCKKCSYPEPCRFPLEKRPPVESFGIDLIGTLKNLERSTPVSQDTGDHFNHYSIILLE